MLLKRATMVLVYCGLVLVAMAVVDLLGQAVAAEDQERDGVPAAEAVRGIVRVEVMGTGNEIRRSGSGFVVQTDHVVTAAHIVQDEDRIVVVVPSERAGRMERDARVLRLERRVNLALLVVRGLDLEPFVLAKDGFDLGRNVVSTGIWATGGSAATSLSAAESRGAVSEHPFLPATGNDAAVELLRHNAMIPADGYGGPLLNDCAEVVGVNQGSPEASRRSLRRGQAPQGAVDAAAVTAIMGLLRPAGVSYTRTDSTCQDPVSVALAEAEEARVRIEEAQRAKEDAARLAEERGAEVAAKQAELDQAREDLDAESANVEDLKRRLADAERTGAEGAEKLRTELEEAKDTQTAAQRIVDLLDDEVQTFKRRNNALEDEVEKERQNQVIIIVVAIAVLLLLAAVAGVLYRRRSLELAHVRQQAASGQRRDTFGRLLPNDVNTEHTPDYLLTGSTGDGQTVSLMVPGRRLLDGVVIGRSPRNADFLIDDKTLSRKHATLSILGDGVLGIEDMDTTNGTRVNGRELQPRTATAMRDGDVLDLGAVKLRVAQQR